MPIVVGKSRSHRIGILFEMIRNNLPLILIGGGKNCIQFISVDDLITIIQKCLKIKGKNIFNVGVKKSYTFLENLSYIINNSKSKSKIFSINKFIGNFMINVLIFFKFYRFKFLS